MSINALYQQYLLCREVSTDTRQIKPGCIFFALQGEQFDGNTFAASALAKGASLAVVSNPALKGDQYFYVDNTLHTMQALALHHRKQLSIPVIGITGTNGKTTTKELIARVLAQRFHIHATQGNLNNHIGVPLTLLSIPEKTEIVVCEMGANHIGEIGALCEIALPTYGLITNIGHAHLEGFGSFEGVIQAKSELFQFLQRNKGLIFLNADDPTLSGMRTVYKSAVTYGLGDEVETDIHFQYLPKANKNGFQLKDRKSAVVIESNMFGHYNAGNVLAAFAVGSFFEVDTQRMAAAISDFAPSNNRSQVLQVKNCTVIKDAYNANPSSMALAIHAFMEQFPVGIMVLGDMKELGSSSAAAHQEIIYLATRSQAKKIYLVGPEFMKACSSDQDERIQCLRLVEDLKAHWDWTACNGEAILIKGSRSMRLEKLLDE